MPDSHFTVLYAFDLVYRVFEQSPAHYLGWWLDDRPGALVTFLPCPLFGLLSYSAASFSFEDERKARALRARFAEYPLIEERDF